MRIREICGDSARFVRDAIWGRWKVWGILIIYSVIFPLILGYMMEIFRGVKSPPDVSDRKKLFDDGLKYFAVQVIYSIPVLIVFFILFLLLVMPDLTHSYNLTYMRSSGPAFSSGAYLASPPILMKIMILGAVFYYLLSLVVTIGIIRTSRSDIFEDAFDFGAIRARIAGIGWGSYLVALVIPSLVQGLAAVVVLSLNAAVIWFPVAGSLLAFVVSPFISVFVARYLTLVYETIP
jgi:Protein of unknown function (DUF4013)